MTRGRFGNFLRRQQLAHEPWWLLAQQCRRLWVCAVAASHARTPWPVCTHRV